MTAPHPLELRALKSLFMPATSETSDVPDRSLLIILHGRGESARLWKHFPPELDLPNLDTLLLNAPTPRAEGGFSWYDPAPNQLPGILESRALLTDAFTEIHALGYPPERCILLGFSQGCVLTLDFGTRYPHRLAGYLGISGYAYDPVAILRDLRPEPKTGAWLITHGSHDEILPLATTHTQIETLREGGLPIVFREYAKGHTIQRPDEFADLKKWIAERMHSRPLST